MDLVEIKLNEMLKENKDVELGNIYAFINDKMIDHNNNLMKELGIEFGSDNHDKIEILTSEMLKSIYNYIDRVHKQMQPLDLECKLDLFR